jgi:hypothetical protein
VVCLSGLRLFVRLLVQWTPINLSLFFVSHSHSFFYVIGSLWAAESALTRDLALPRLRGPIRVKRSGSVKGVEEDGQEERQAIFT